MMKGKFVMKKTGNAANRQVTFPKRPNGLLKKAFELSFLCDVMLQLSIFSQKGRLYEFSCSVRQETIEQYCTYTKESPTHKPKVEQHMQTLNSRFRKHQSLDKCLFSSPGNKLPKGQSKIRKLLGQGLSSCSVEEFREIGSQLEQSLKNIRARRAKLLKKQIQQLKVKERMLLEDNEQLCEKCCGGEKP